MLTLTESISVLDHFLNAQFELLPPFDPLSLAFCCALSKQLFREVDIQKSPDLSALAFWLRKSHLHELSTAFQAKQQPNCLSVPRGLAFHIPPSNVDTMFVYSWLLSLLAGNANLVRLPSKRTFASTYLLEVIKKTLDQVRFSQLRKNTFLISYGHDDAITAKISLRSDLRIIWGGDNTIAHIRQIPIKPQAKELVFADRFSFAVLDALAYLRADGLEKKRIAASFFNDLYWFDQAACSSPRMLFWRGTVDACKQASELFYPLLESEIQRKGYQIALGSFLQKKTFVYGKAISLDMESVAEYGNALTVIQLSKPLSLCRDHCGSGLLYQLFVNNLDEIASFISKKDQTLSYYGCLREELSAFARKLNGKGLHRIVPLGRALEFGPIWDGYDLLQELTQHLTID